MVKNVGRTMLCALLAGVLLSACAHQQGQVASPADAMSMSPVIDRIVQRGALVVGTVGSMPPMNMTTKGGELMGMDVDLAKAVAANMGVELQMRTMDFVDLLPALDSGEVDMVLASMTITPRRNMKYAFVGPYMVTGKSILADKGLVTSIKAAGDINEADITLTALAGSTSQVLIETLFPAATLIAVRDYDEAIKLLLEDKADAMFADYPVCAMYAYRNRGRGLMALKEPLTYEPLGIAVPPNDPLLVNLLQNLLLRLESSGEMKKLRARWFENTEWVKLLP